MIQFFVTGIPKAQPRVKFASRGKFGKAYTPDTANDWKALVMQAAKPHLPGTPLEGPLRVSLYFYFPRPKGHYNSKGEIKPSAPYYHTSKPDRDNLDKCILDAMTAIGMWGDDCQVCEGSITKIYTHDKRPSPGCAVSIQQIITP